MDVDGALDGPRPRSSLLLIGLTVALRHRSHRRRRNNPPRRTPAPERSHPQRGGLEPIRSETRILKVESLRVYERPGFGHTLTRHVNHAPNADVERLRREPDIPASGSFHDEATAQRCVDAAISAHSAAIGNWLRASHSKGPFVRDFEMNESVGTVLTRSAYNAAIRAGRPPTLVEAHSVRIVLRRSPQFANGFFVLTAYPLPRAAAGQVPAIEIAPLARYEGQGHTISHHVNVPPSALATRLEDEPDISAASRFSDLATAEKAVRTAIADRAGEIHDWLASGTRQAFRGDVSLHETVGVVLTREAFAAGRRQPMPANRIHFVLVRSDTHPHGFCVKTAYPVIPW